jgi:hypothetical protein
VAEREGTVVVRVEHHCLGDEAVSGHDAHRTQDVVVDDVARAQLIDDHPRTQQRPVRLQLHPDRIIEPAMVRTRVGT